MRTHRRRRDPERTGATRDAIMLVLAGVVVFALCISLRIDDAIGRWLGRQAGIAGPVMVALTILLLVASVLALLRTRRAREETAARGEAEAALEESEQRYRNLVDRSPDAILVHSDGRFVFANAAAGRLLGADVPRIRCGPRRHGRCLRDPDRLTS